MFSAHACFPNSGHKEKPLATGLCETNVDWPGEGAASCPPPTVLVTRVTLEVAIQPPDLPGHYSMTPGHLSQDPCL